MQSTRREFLTQGLAGATLFATGAHLPGFLTRTALAARAARDDTILVVVQMTGGNDGLNMLIPYEDDLYHRARPTLRIAPGRVLPLESGLGLHPDMTGFQRLYDEGLLSVVTNVGYPNPDRSHFASMDVWHCAETNAKRPRDGWLGRVVDRYTRAGAAPLALHLDYEVLPLALKTQSRPVPSIRDMEAFRLRGAGEPLEAAIAAPRDNALEDLLFVQRTALASCANARRIEQVMQAEPTRSPYPAYGLANRLQQIARLIGADFGPRIYYTSIGGFDTHARQVLAHGPLLRELADSIAAFFKDLKQRGAAEKVALMTFSEFGRRVKENGSQGTDHGAAAPMFLVGPSCQPGVHGGPPDLANLHEGDIRHKTDFRRVYASVLEDWLSVDQSAILPKRFEPLALLR